MRRDEQIRYRSVLAPVDFDHSAPNYFRHFRSTY